MNAVCMVEKLFPSVPQTKHGNDTDYPDLLQVTAVKVIQYMLEPYP